MLIKGDNSVFLQKRFKQTGIQANVIFTPLCGISQKGDLISQKFTQNFYHYYYHLGIV